MSDLEKLAEAIEQQSKAISAIAQAVIALAQAIAEEDAEDMPAQYLDGSNAQ